MAERYAKRVVALFCASDEMVDLLQWMQGRLGVPEFRWCRFADVKKGQINFAEYLAECNPQVVVVDIAPPYLENWQFFQTLRAAPVMRGRTQVLLTTNKAKLDAVLAEDSHAIDLVGSPDVLHQVLTAIENVAVPDTALDTSAVQAALRRHPRRGPRATKTWERPW